MNSDTIVTGNEHSERIDWIDVGKAVSIVLVVVAHTVPGKMLAKVIHSFVIPFFFMVSATTFKFSPDMKSFIQKSKKTFRHLLVPAFIMILINILIYVLRNINTVDSVYFKDKFLSILYASGTPVRFEDKTIPAVGAVWFFFTLAFSRTILDFLGIIINEKLLPFIVIVLSVAGVVISHYMWLPLSFDLVLALMPFLYVGNQLKKVNFEYKLFRNLLLLFTLWGIIFFFTFYSTRSYYEAAARRYPLFPLCYLTALSGSLALAYFCQILCKHFEIISIPLKFLGRNSLYFLCVHIFDFSFPALWKLSSNNYINIIFRLAEDLILFIIVVFIIRIISKLKSRETDR